MEAHARADVRSSVLRSQPASAHSVVAEALRRILTKPPLSSAVLQPAQFWQPARIGGPSERAR